MCLAKMAALASMNSTGTIVIVHKAGEVRFVIPVSLSKLSRICTGRISKEFVATAYVHFYFYHNLYIEIIIY